MLAPVPAHLGPVWRPSISTQVLGTGVQIQSIMHDATVLKIIAGKLGDLSSPNTATTGTAPPEFAGDWGDSDCDGSISDSEPELDGDWGDSDFNGNESGPE